MSVAELRPLSLGELLDRTFSLYRSHFWLFVGIMAVPYLLSLAVGLAGVTMRGVGQQATRPGTPAGAAVTGAAAGVLLIGIFAVVVLASYLLAQAATVFAVSEIYLGRPASIRQSYARVRGKLGRLIAVFLMIALAVIGGMILLIVPGILALLATALAVPAAVLENRTARAALSRSVELTKGSWGRIFVVFLLVLLLSWVGALVFELPFSIAHAILLKQGQDSSILAALSQVGNFLAGVLVGPLGTIALALVYYDARVRKEAFDLQMMMAALDSATPPGIPPAVTGA